MRMPPSVFTHAIADLLRGRGRHDDTGRRATTTLVIPLTTPIERLGNGPSAPVR
jgi:hypothetical protein